MRVQIRHGEIYGCRYLKSTSENDRGMLHTPALKSLQLRARTTIITTVLSDSILTSHCILNKEEDMK